MLRAIKRDPYLSRAVLISGFVPGQAGLRERPLPLQVPDRKLQDIGFLELAVLGVLQAGAVENKRLQRRQGLVDPRSPPFFH